MRFAVGAVILAGISVAGVSARADVWTDCTTSRDAALRLKACTDVISDTGLPKEQHAAAYRNRGLVCSQTLLLGNWATVTLVSKKKRPEHFRAGRLVSNAVGKGWEEA